MICFIASVLLFRPPWMRKTRLISVFLLLLPYLLDFLRVLYAFLAFLADLSTKLAFLWVKSPLKRSSSIWLAILKYTGPAILKGKQKNAETC